MEQFKELAVLVVNSIIRDGAKDAFLNADPIRQEEIMMAYVQSEVKKFSQFANLYHTTPEVKAAFIRLVLGV